MAQAEVWRELITSGLKGDLVVLFRQNPGIIDTNEAVARRLGVDPEAIDKEVRELVHVGFLKKREFGKYEVISLDEKRDKEIQESATAFLTSKVVKSEASP